MPTEIALADLPDRYGFVDPASSKKGGELKLTKARSAIVTITQDWLGRVYVLDAWAARASTDTLIERMYKTHETWNLRVLGGEASGLQELFQEAVLRDARLRGKHLPLRPVHQPTRIQKDWRIRTALQPLIANGRLFVRPEMTDLKTEIANFPLDPLKDMIDALASAVRLLPPVRTGSEKRASDDALLDYLRKTGAPLEYIQAVAARRATR